MISGVWTNHFPQTGPNVETFTSSGLTPSTTYEYCVRGCNSDGCTNSVGVFATTTP